uniref:E3 UFM1-protein ligase 1 homolog n=2 Tax=Steinernema glaseri TaxID=37863 RepID=A0A1I7YS91_9BILA
MTSWADIKKLAADLQRVQLTEGAKKLSENNCIEVVHKLMSAKLLDLIFTTDGKEYITKKHLVTEIRNECLAHDGRAPIGDIAAALHVEFGQIEAQINDVVAEDPDFFVCNGELISSDYIRKLSLELDAKLKELGSISLQHLTKTMHIPTEVLNNHILPNIGSTIDAVQYGDMLYTSTYLRAQRNALRAVLSALTRVTQLSRIQQHLNLSPSLFSSLWDELKDMKAVPGNIVGNKNSSNALYVPNIHERMVKQYTLNTFHENQFIDFGTLKKLFVTDPTSYLKQVFSKEEYKKNLVVFPSCVISVELWQDIEKTVVEEMAKTEYCDLVNLIPPGVPFEDSDIEVAGQLLLKKYPDWRTTESGLCYNTRIIGKVVKALDAFILEKAETLAPEYAKQMRQQQPQKNKVDSKKATATADDDDWDANPGKKKKGGKQKGGKQQKVTEEPKQVSSSIKIQSDEIEEELKTQCNLPEELVEEIRDDIQRQVDVIFRERVEAVLLSIHQSAAQNQKKTLQLLQQQVQNLYGNICMFEQGTSEFDIGTATSLKQHLLRTLCTDFANVVLEYVSGVSNIGSLTPKVRTEVLNGISSADTREPIIELYNNLTDLEKFFEAATAASSIRLRVPDKKQMEDMREAYVADLRAQLKASEDPAASFLLAVLIFLATRLNVYVHASGKFVRELLNHIEKAEDVKSSEVELLNECHKLVVASLKKNRSDEEGEDIIQKIEELKAFVA